MKSESESSYVRHLLTSFIISVLMSLVLMAINHQRINAWGGLAIAVFVFLFVFFGRALAGANLDRRE